MEYGKKNNKMIDFLKEAESKVIDVIVKKTTLKAKSSKTQSKIKTARKGTVKEKPEANEYLKMCNAKQKKNNEKLASIAEELSDLKQAAKTTKKKRTTRISIKPSAKKKVIDTGEKICLINHADVGMFKEETDKRYCRENMDLDGIGCASCKIKFGDKEEIGVMVPSVKCPIYVCSGRTLHDCVYSYCNNCYTEKSNEGIGKRKRLRRS